MRKSISTGALFAAICASYSHGQVPIFSAALESTTDIQATPNATDGGVLAGAVPAYPLGAIGNAFQSTSSTANAGSWIRWNDTKITHIFTNNGWSDTAGITVDLYFFGASWSASSGQEGLWSIVRRSSSGDLGDSYFFTSVNNGKLRITIANDSSDQYKYTFDGATLDSNISSIQPNIPLANGTIYHLTVSVHNGVMKVWMDGGSNSNATPAATINLPASPVSPFPAYTNWKLPPTGGSVQAREMDIGNRGPTPNFGGTLRSGDWVDNVGIYNGEYTPTQLGAGILLPVSIIHQDVTSGYAPLTVHFDGSSSHDTGGTAGGSLVSYAWDFDNDGTTDDSSGPVVAHTYALPGTYTCKLTVTDNDGNTAANTVDIHVNSLPAAGLLAITSMTRSGNDLTSVTTQRAGAGATYTASSNLATPPDAAHVESGGTLTNVPDALIGLDIPTVVGGLGGANTFVAGYFNGAVAPDGTPAPELFIVERTTATTDNFQIQLLTNGPGEAPAIAATLQVRDFDYAATNIVISGNGYGGVGIDLDALGVTNIRGMRIPREDGLGGNTGVDPGTFVGIIKPCNVPFADADGDGDVDADDFGKFQRCYTGPSGAIDPVNCICFDRGNGLANNVIDDNDYTAFKNCMTRSGIVWTQAATPSCVP